MSITAAGNRINRFVWAAALAFAMLFFPVSEQSRQLPHSVAVSGEYGSAKTALLSSSMQTIFQFMELTRETRGETASETFRRENRESSRFARLLFLGFFAILLCLLQTALLPAVCKAFPFLNSFIHSRRIILRYIERQDGVKIPSVRRE